MYVRLITALLISASVVACGGKLAGYDNAEIAAKHDACVRNNPTSPGRVTACENIKEECQRRRKKGIYAC